MNCSAIIKEIKTSIAFIVTFGPESNYLGSGSGFVFGKPEVIVTCNHVVKGCNSVLVKFPGASNFVQAKIVLQDEEHDLALLKYDGDKKNPLKLGNLSEVTEGIEVLFAGYPVGLTDLTTHQGIISAITQDTTGITSYLIDGTVNSGNSGCPLMTNDGGVIGVVNAKRWASGETLNKVQKMPPGALSLYNVDLVGIYQALTDNVQIGIGAAVPASYIPDYKEMNSKSETRKVVKAKK